MVRAWALLLLPVALASLWAESPKEVVETHAVPEENLLRLRIYRCRMM